MKAKAKAADYTLAIPQEEYKHMFEHKRTPAQIHDQVKGLKEQYALFKSINPDNRSLEPGERIPIVYKIDSDSNRILFQIIHRPIEEIPIKEREKGFKYIPLNDCIYSWYLLSVIGIADCTLYDLLELPPLPSEYTSAISSAAIGMFHRINNKTPVEQDINGKYIITKSTRQAEIQLESLQPLDPIVQMFFDILTIEYAKQKSKEIKLSVSQYMKIRKISSRNIAIEQYTKAVDSLKTMSYISSERIGKGLKQTGITSIIQKICTTESGYITGVLLSDDMFDYCQCIENQIAQYPLSLLQLSVKHDIYAYYLGYYLFHLNRIQAGDDNQNHHKIIAILQDCGFMDIAESKKKFGRIRDNLEKALNKLIEIGVLLRFQIFDESGAAQSLGNITSFDGLYLDVTTTTPRDKEQHLIESRKKQEAKKQEAQSRKKPPKKAQK